MPITVNHDDERRRLTATANGRIDTATFGEFVRTARAGDLRSYTLLIDARAATFDITADDLRTLILPIVQQLRANDRDRAPVALVVQDAAALLMARAFETVLGGQPDVVYFGVFPNMITAEAWLTSLQDPRR